MDVGLASGAVFGTGVVFAVLLRLGWRPARILLSAYLVILPALLFYRGGPPPGEVPLLLWLTLASVAASDLGLASVAAADLGLASVAAADLGCAAAVRRGKPFVRPSAVFLTVLSHGLPLLGGLVAAVLIWPPSARRSFRRGTVVLPAGTNAS